MQRIIVGSEEAGCRLDRLLRKRLPLMPLSSIYKLIRKGGVRLRGRKVGEDYRPQEGDGLDVDVDAAEIAMPHTPDSSLAQLTGTSFFRRNFSVLYEDDYLLACNKPSGVVVHPGSGHNRFDSLIELAIAYLIEKNGVKAGDKAALVHRLDRDTSGVILIAKNKKTLRALHEAFVNHAVKKEYRALCHHRPPDNEGKVEIGLCRTYGRNSGMKMRVDSHGKTAVSRYSLTEYCNDLSSVTVILDTGKTHQIRVMMAHLGAPVVGDVRYGDPAADNRLFGGPSPRLFLHAYSIGFSHPCTKKHVLIRAPVPPIFAEVMSVRHNLT